MGVVVRRYIDFLILLIPIPLVSVLFLQQHRYFLFILLNVYTNYNLFIHYSFIYIFIVLYYYNLLANLLLDCIVPYIINFIT